VVDPSTVEFGVASNFCVSQKSPKISQKNNPAKGSGVRRYLAAAQKNSLG